ncbi:MAG TPA: SDR family NAD(P)-dependent oxidoreductase, partial [Solirubrobacteraceae bacterium]
MASPAPQTLNGRVALVTGAGSESGIGMAVARALARAGARVAITSTTDRIHDRAAELVAEGADVASLTADLTDRSAVASLVAAVAGRLGPVDVLVNNAGMNQIGIEEPSPPFHRFDHDAWDRQLAITLTTAFNVTREVVGGLIDRGWGR